MSSVTPRAGSSLGAKAEMLLQLRTVPALQSVVPPVVPVPRELGERWAERPDLAGADHDERVRRLGRWLGEELDELRRHLRATCGPPPWIVRSSGEEDAADAPRAGAYLSLPCDSEDRLGDTLAAVVLSGLRPATASSLEASGAVPAPIAAFIQPLVGAPDPPADGPDCTPLVSPRLLAGLRTLLAAVHDQMPATALACEWVLDGPDVISVSTTTLAAGGVSGNLTAAFGHFAAQHASPLQSRALWLSEVEPPIHSGGRLRWVGEGSWRLVQVRPAGYASDVGLVEGLSDADRDRLRSAGFRELGPVQVLAPPPRAKAGGALRAANLEEAWEIYLSLEPASRAGVVAAVVDTGTPDEHAGLNFMAEGVALLRAPHLPSDALALAVDVGRSSCFVSSDVGTPVALEGEATRFVSLPEEAFLLLGATDPRSPLDDPAGIASELCRRAPTGPDGATAPEARRILEVVHTVPAGDEVRRKIADRSMFPESTTRLQHPAFGWISPSLLGLALARLSETTGLEAAALPADLRTAAPGPVRRYLEARTPADAGRAAALGVRAREALQTLGTSQGGAEVEELRRRVAAIASRLPGDAEHLPIEATAELVAALDALALHGAAERGALLDRWIRWLDGLDETTTRSLLAVRLDPLPAELRVRWLEWAAAAPAPQVERVHQAFTLLRKALGTLHTGGAPGAALEAVTRLAEAERIAGSPVSLAEALRIPIVDAFDAGGKRLLRDLSVDASEARRRRLRELLFAWIEWLGRALPGDPALAAYADWLSRHRPRADAPEVLLTDRVWTEWREEARTRGRVELPSLHQLLNVLHQTSLGLARRSADGPLPERAARLAGIAAGFARAPGSVLGHQADLFELERPMGIHKASLVCLPEGRILTEFAEPPDADEERLGRLIAFGDLLAHFTDWYDLAAFETRRKRDAGIWVLEIRSTPKPGTDAAMVREWSFCALLTLFDASYDCSGVPTAQGALRDRLSDPMWPELFSALVAYRADLRDQPGRLASRCDPLPMFLAPLLCSPGHEAWIAERWHEGVERGLERLGELTGSAAPLELEAWRRRLERIQALSLQLAARDPEAMLDWLDGLPRTGPLHYPVGRALLTRAAIQEPLARRLVAGRSARPTPLQDLCLHVRPDLFLRFGDRALARRLAAEAPAHHRALRALLSRTPSDAGTAPAAEGRSA